MKKIATITYGLHRTPFGACLIGVTSRAVAYLSFAETKGRAAAERRLHQTFPEAILVRNQTKTASFITRIFKKGERPPLNLHGTPFQMKVWHALARIPAGRTKTYAEIARAVGSPKAARAVGTACGANPVAYAIPCHRVVASDGSFGDYRWGLKLKKEMLDREKR